MEMGWIMLHRQLLENPVVMKDTAYLSIWIYLLLNATHKERNMLFNGKKIKLRKGQLITGRKSIAKFLNISESKVQRVLKSFESEDSVYLDSIGVQFKKLNFNDSLWVPSTRVIEEIPPLTTENEGQYLKNSQFFELEDAMGVYLTKVIEVLDANEIAPFTYVKPSIIQVLLNRRKLDYIRKLETEIIDEATQKKEFEVFTPKE